MPTSEALSRMSMDSAALLSGTDSLRLGEGFSGSAGDSEPHRICAAVRQAVSGGMLVMRAGAGSFCGRLLNGQGRRPCRRHRWNWLKAIIRVVACRHSSLSFGKVETRVRR